MKKKAKLPKPRNKLHEILALKATSNAAGKHSKTKTLSDLRIRELQILNRDHEAD